MVLGFGKKGPGPVGCYGKLPLHRDYVSCQSDGPEARKLSEWLDEGYRLTGGDDDPDGAAISFVMAGKRSLLGDIWPSGDASGTRRFPFTLFSTLSGRNLVSQGPRIPMALGPLWTGLAEAVAAVREAATPDGIQGLVSAMNLPEPAEPEEVVQHFGQAAGEPDDLGAAPPILVDVVRLADALAGEKKGPPPPFAIRIPLVTAYPAPVEATAWLSVLGGRLHSTDFFADCHLFFRPATEAADGDLFVFHRELRPEDFGFLLAPSEEYPYGNLLGVAPDEEAAERVAAALDEKGGGDPSLADLVALGAEPLP